MTKTERIQKRDLAKMLFIYENLTQKEIAERVGASEKSLSKWQLEGNWESLKVSITITKEEQLKSLYRQLAELNKAISEREGKRFATASEADVISKLSNAIDKMESDIGVSDIVSVGKKFLTWLRRYDLTRAQEITPLFDSFIKENLR